MIEVISMIISQEFLKRAMFVGILTCLCCALLGVSLVLKRFSMIGDGLSHVGFGAMAIGAASGVAPLYFALPIVIVAAFLLLRMSEKGKIKGDAAIALISTGSLAVGVMVTSMTTGMNVDIYNYMFGSILTMSTMDVTVSAVLCIVVITLFIVFYHEIFAVTFDENFAKATGTKATVYNMLISALTAITVVIGMKIMGALLISSLIIFPTVSSMRICKSFKSVVFSSVFISVFCFLTGLVLSVKYEAPTGASVVCVNILVFFVLSAIRSVCTANLNRTLKRLITVVTVLISVFCLCFALFYGDYFKYDKDRTTIVTTSFAPYDFARQIAGESADVVMLLAPGEESHTYEPTPGDIMRIEECDLFIYGGGESEKWVDDVLSSFDKNINTVKMMDVVELHEEEHNHDSHEEHSHSEEIRYDEHVWTSPLNAIKIVETISEMLISVDSENSEIYISNTERYIDDLFELDNRFEDMITHSESDMIIVGDRFPLMYFTERYNLLYESAFSGCSAQTETNPVTIAGLINTAESDGISTIFKIDLSKGNVADTIAETINGKTDRLYSCHIVSAEDFANGETYISLMERNYNALRSALN